MVLLEWADVNGLLYDSDKLAERFAGTDIEIILTTMNDLNCFFTFLGIQCAAGLARYAGFVPYPLREQSIGSRSDQ